MRARVSTLSIALASACALAGCGRSAPQESAGLPTAQAASVVPAQPVHYVANDEPAAPPTPTEATEQLSVVASEEPPGLLHERDDYVVAPPDVLSIKVKLPSREDEARLLGLNGEHLVLPDGAINLGVKFGFVAAAGLTVDEIQRRVRERVASDLENCDVTVSVQAQNSKVYYVIVEREDSGDSVIRAPIATGNETVADALKQLKDVDDLARKRIWIARPKAGGPDEILPVNPKIFAADPPVELLYRLQPGDRIFIHADNPLEAAIGK